MHRPTVLLAEDEPIISLDIKDVLEAQGFLVVQATALPEVVGACRQHRPDYILLNYALQHYGDGLRLARTIRRLCSAPIKFVTGAGPQEIGASGYFDAQLDVLYKPFSPAQLQRWVRTWSV